MSLEKAQEYAKLNYQGQKIRIKLAATFEEFRKIIQERIHVKAFKLKYQDEDDQIQMENEQDFRIALNYFNGRQFELTVVPTLVQNDFATFQDLPEVVQQRFVDTFIPDGFIQCCMNPACKLCAGTNHIVLNEMQRAKADDKFMQIISAKLPKLQQIFKQRWSIAVNDVDEFLNNHIALRDSGRLVQQQVKPHKPPSAFLPMQTISQIAQKNPFETRGSTNPYQQGPSNISQLIQGQSAMFASCNQQSKISQIAKKSIYQASFGSVHFLPVYEPNSHVQIILKIKNCGEDDWPKNVRIRSTECDQVISQSIRSLRWSEEADFKIQFLAPMKERQYHYSFRLCYGDENQTQWFGPRQPVDFDVKYNDETRASVYFEVIQQIYGGNRNSIREYVDEKLSKQPQMQLEQFIDEVAQNHQDKQDIFI